MDPLSICMIMSAAPSSSSSSCSASSTMWADLPNDILEQLVRSMHSPFDRLRFGAVCRSWRDAAAAVKQNPGAGRCGVAPLPFMTFRDPADGGVKGGRGGAAAEEALDDDDAGGATSVVTRCFYSLSEDKVYRLQIPSESRDWHCFGSSRGWLGMIDLSAKPFLFDPLSGARVDLPSLTTLTRLILLVKTRKKDGATVYIYKEPNGRKAGYPITGKDLQDMFIDRLALSSSSPLDDPNCIVMTTVSGYCLPAYTRPGGDAWVELVPHLPRGEDCWHFRDIIYHDHGVFYAVAGEEETFAITFDVGGCSNSPPSVEVLVPTVSPYPDCSCEYYLVVLPSGDLLRVIRYKNPDSATAETDLFQLQKLNGASSWVDVEEIGDCCLFLGAGHSMSLPASQVLGKYRANHIFFTDDREAYVGNDHEGLDHGIYEIKEETVELFCRIDARCVFPQPMWITPRF